MQTIPRKEFAHEYWNDLRNRPVAVENVECCIHLSLRNSYILLYLNFSSFGEKHIMLLCCNVYQIITCYVMLRYVMLCYVMLC